jgi:hypothetical protein
MPRIAVLGGLALALLGTLTVEVAAQTSCSAWKAVCLTRCPSLKIGCAHCDDLLATCRRTGCWTEGKNYGNARHCNLKKS